MAGSAAMGLVLAAGAIAAAGPWESSGQRTAERDAAIARDARHRGTAAAGRPRPAPAPAGAAVPLMPPAPSAPPVLAPADASATLPAGAGQPLAPRLDPLMDAAGLGPVRTGAVVDVATGRLLYDHRSRSASTPASTTKLATAVAALGLLGPDHRVTTTVVATGADRVVLVGAGDPTLELGGLAADTAAALKARGTTTVRLGYDTSLYTGPARHPIGPNDNLAPVTPLMVREARLDDTDAGPAPRAQDPAAAAADAFAALLRRRGVTVVGDPAPGRGAGGAQLAAHQSEPVSALVERMLTNSDNDLAEALARQAARATGRPVSFAGGAAAIRQALRRYGVPLAGAVFTDGSGLSRDDALAPVTLARVLALAADPRHPELGPVLAGLPVAGFTGTLAGRFLASPGAGLVRAKTGTLTGTNTIAGTAVSPSGRLLAFAFMTQGAPLPAPAQSALDTLATALTH